jgi:response regulator NasT
MGRLRVLVAEDDPSVRAVLVEMVEALGHEVVAQAQDGQEAVELAARSSPDLALLDIRMPRMDGLAAAQAIMQHHLLPTLIITAHAEESLINQAAQSGAFAYLLKPVSQERLAAAISTACARFRDQELLRDEVGSLRCNLEDRKLIERAKGILMRDLGVSEPEAYRWLKLTSSRSNDKIAEVARRIVALDTSPRT